MRQRAIFAMGGLAVAGVFGIAAACTFPDASYRDPSGTLGDDGGEDAAAPGDDRDSDVDPNGRNEDAATREDGGGRIEDEAGCGADRCDCDQDGVGNNGCAVPDGGAVDCDDFDKLVHPGQSFVSSPWTTSSPHLPAGDWNCDGTVTKQYPHSVGACAGLSCAKQEGFVGDPGCGETADYVVCKSATLSCSEESREQRVQGCR